RWALGALWLRRVLVSATPLPSQSVGGARWLESSRVRTPLVAGCLSPAVVLPSGWRNWNGSELSAVISHETAHIRRNDPWFKALAGINRVVFWFHPVAWWLERRIASEAELACDDEASLEIGDHRAYAKALVEVTAGAGLQPGRFAPAGVAMAGVAPITKRVDRLLTVGPRGRGVLNWRHWAAVSALALG